MESRKKSASPLSFASITVTIIAVLSLLTTTTVANSRISFHSPTATYSGFLSVRYTGVYHYVDAQPVCESSPLCLVPSEIVFYLATENATIIRLVFFCGAGVCLSAEQLPFSDGMKINVQGTLIVPSSWQSSEYQPTLRFIADLYVFNYTTV